MASGYSKFNDSFEEHHINYGSIRPGVTFAKCKSKQKLSAKCKSKQKLSANSSMDYFQLCDKITTNIFTINNATTNLERMGRFIGSIHDSQVIRDRISQLSADTIGYIGDTTSLVKSMLLLIQGNKHRKVHANKLQTEFKSSAGRFSELQKKVVTTFSNARLPMDMVKQAEDTTSELIKSGEKDLAQKQELLNIEYELAMQQERQHRVEALEKDMVDIGDIMRELSTMTAAQGEVITSIEDNVENAADYVEEGRSELIKAASYRAKHRKRCCILILILIIILIIIGIIIAIHNTNPN